MQQLTFSFLRRAALTSLLISFYGFNLQASELAEFDPNTTKVFKLYRSNKFHYLKFTVNSAGTEAQVSGNEIANAGDLPMRFIFNKRIYWPLAEGQEIPAVWHVGSTSGDCYYDVSFEIIEIKTNNNNEPHYLVAEWTIPAYVSYNCSSSGQRSFKYKYSTSWKPSDK